MNLSAFSLLLLAIFSLTQDQDRRIRKLEDSLMAPCCYSQSIREHMSMEAAQMRDEVSNMVLSGKSDKEILAYYESKYGKTILIVPSGMAGLLAFGVPIGVALIATGLAAFYVLWSVHKRSTIRNLVVPTPSEPISEEMIRRIRSELQDDI
jgi:cytochrome c-type biogenesis protein CcmH/NrfF